MELIKRIKIWSRSNAVYKLFYSDKKKQSKKEKQKQKMMFLKTNFF